MKESTDVVWRLQQSSLQREIVSPCPAAFPAEREDSERQASASPTLGGCKVAVSAGHGSRVTL